MNNRKLLFLFLLVPLIPLSAQRTNKVKVERVFLHSPTRIIPDLQEISVKIDSGNVSMDETLYFLEHAGSENRLELGASAKFSNQIDELYFQFPGYRLVDSSAFRIELIFDRLNIKKHLHSGTIKLDENNPMEIFDYRITGNFPCSLRIWLDGNVILEQDIFNQENNFTLMYNGSKEVYFEGYRGYKIIGNPSEIQSKYFKSEGDLISSYEGMKDVIYSIIERAELICALTEARKMIERHCLFAYYPQTLEITAPGGKKYHSTELSTAQFIAKEAFEKFADDINKNVFQSGISPAVDIWKKEILNFETGKSISRLNDKSVALLYNNLALVELYADSIQAAEEWLLKAKELKKSDPIYRTTDELIRKSKVLERENSDINSMGEKLIPLNEALGYLPGPDIATIADYIFKYQKLEDTKAYQRLLTDEQ